MTSMTIVTVDADGPHPIGFHTIHPTAEDKPRGIGFHTLLARKKVGEKEAESNGREKLNVFHGWSD